MEIFKERRIEVGEWTKGMILRILAKNFEKGCDDPGLVQTLTRFSFDVFFGALNGDDISFLGDSYPPAPNEVKSEISRRIEATPEDTASPWVAVALAEGLATLILEMARSWDEEEILWQRVAEYVKNGGETQCKSVVRQP